MSRLRSFCAFRVPQRAHAGICWRFRRSFFCYWAARLPRMPLIADRFFRLNEDSEIVDLATAEAVRVTIEPPPAHIRDRARTCDRLAAVRHPLLLPLIDYGMHGGRWYEAHARLPALRVPDVHTRGAALHLVRFRRAAGVHRDAATSARHVRPAIETSAPASRPIGVFLQMRPALDAIRSV